MWTDAFMNYAKVLITKHPLLAGDLFMSSRMNDTAFHTIMTVNTITPKTTFFKVIIITWSLTSIIRESRVLKTSKTNNRLCFSGDRFNVWKLGFSPIKLHELEEFLKLYPNKTSAYELLDGFSNGFKIKYSVPRLALETKNLK
jgi:hypothetical protein